jgi:iron complex transport system ATP-binding protein
VAAAADALEDDAMTPPLLAAEVGLPPRLQPVRLEAGAGERIAVIGPNGSGKTSLLRALAGVEEQSGSVTISGEALASTPTARCRRLLSFLPASRELRWPIPVRDLIALGLEQFDGPAIDRVMEPLDLQPFAEREVDSLSTGERARVLLARALVAQPRLLLLDEPLSNLDPAWVLRTLDVLERAAASGAALLVSLHDLSLLGRFSRVLLLEGGALRFDGEPDALMRSALLAEVFGVEPDGAGWKLSPWAGRRSSP